ncbi:MAG: DUF4345 family protein [Rhodothermaceae bacterium]|nr:DUF4345 family protein [Rhodothermaceae bacterium]
MTSLGSNALRVVLLLAGAFILFTALNVALGGITTMGWQGDAAFFEVTDESAFLIHDSHTRFLGGLWAGGGLLFFAAAFDLRRFGSALQVVLAFIVLGGLARFTQARPDLLFSADIAGSLAAELIGVPMLWFWISRALRSERSA